MVKKLRIQTQIVLVLLLAVLMIIGMGWYYARRVKTLMIAEVESNLQDLAFQGAQTLHGRIRERLGMLETIAAQPLIADPDTSVALKQPLLQREAERRGLVRLGIADLQGHSLTSDGVRLFIGDRQYFHTAARGASNISSLLMCRILNIPIVVHAAPLKDAGGRIFGVIFATERIDFFSALLQSGAFRVKGGSAFVIDAGGRFISGRENADMPGNLFSLLNAENDPADVALLRHDVERGGVFLSNMMLDGVCLYMAGVPVKSAPGWYLAAAAPADMVLAKTDAVLRMTVASTLLYVTLLTAVGGYMLVLRRKYLREKGVASIAIQSAGLFYLEFDARGELLFANPLFCGRTGRSAASLRGLRLEQFAAEGALPAALLTPEREHPPFLLPVKKAEGGLLYVQWHVQGGAGDAAYVLLGTDLTDRLQAEAEQSNRAAQRDLRIIFDNLPFPLLYKDQENRILIANDAACRLTGAAREDLLGHDVMSVAPFRGRSSLLLAFRQAVFTGRVIKSEFSLDKNGTARHFEVSQIPLRDAGGAFTGVVSTCIDVTERKDTEARLTEELRRLQGILDTSPVGVVITVDDTVCFINPRAVQLTGARVGQRMAELPLPPDRYEKIKRLVAKRGLLRHLSVVSRGDDGRKHRLLVTVSRTEYRGREGLLAWGMDVTELKKAERQLIQARDAAEAATRAKSEFLATMSHEIRTPMNAILGFSHLFERDNLTPRQRDYLEKIRAAADSLLRIINDILDFSKIEAGRLEIEHVPYSPRAVVDAAWSIIAFTAREKGLDLHRVIAGDLPEALYGDPSRLGQVLTNLLSNAIKFTPRGSVRLEAGVHGRRPDGRTVLEFSVSDTGIGLSEEQQRRLFQPFSQADGSISRRYGGTGLGLAISKRLVELMDGEISVRSEVGRGSTFRCLIPGLPGPDGRTAPDPGEVPDREREPLLEGIDRLRGARILIVDDNDINLEIAGELLKSLGLEPHSAEDGFDALEKLRTEPFDLVFMDMQMPRMDGLEATRRIRAMAAEFPKLGALPVIAMTANAMAADRERCLNVGMNDYIAKPLDPVALQKALLRWLPSGAPDFRPTAGDL